MKTITINTYKFDELSLEARAKALEGVRVSVADANAQCTNEDFCLALEDMERVLDIEIKDWNVDAWSKHYLFEMNKCWEDMEDDPKFLCRYLDDMADCLWHGKFYTKPGIEAYRYSKVLFGGWYFTGYYTDDALIKATDERYEYVRDGFTIHEFVDAALNDFFQHWQRCLEHDYSDEAVEETILINDYDFLEDGRLYR